MTQKGFEEYIFTIYGNKNGTAKSYITGIRIIDQLFENDDVFGLCGKSITCIDDIDLLVRIVDFVCSQQNNYQQHVESFFKNVSSKQTSYPRKGFCSAAVKQLLHYYELEMDSNADELIRHMSKRASGPTISKKLSKLFGIDKQGEDKTTETKVRIGQNYFRKKILENYNETCCVTGLNITQTLRASHISPWAKDAKNRLNPENGLCLSATYDAAFDQHLISFDEDYRMIVSKHIRDHYTNEAAREYFLNFEGKKMIMPKLYIPNQKLLAEHRKSLCF